MQTNFPVKKIQNLTCGVTVGPQADNYLFVTPLVMPLSYQAWLLLWLKLSFYCLQCKEILSTLIITKDFHFQPHWISEHSMAVYFVSYLSPKDTWKSIFLKIFFFFSVPFGWCNYFSSILILPLFPPTNANYFTRVNGTWLIYFCLAVSMHTLLLRSNNAAHQHY